MSLDEIRMQVLRSLVRGVVTAADDTVAYFQRLQVRALGGEVIPDVQHVQPAGLYSVPEEGAQVLLFEVGGARDHVIGIAVADEQHRPKNRVPGETGLHGKSYTAVRCNPNGDVEIHGGSGTTRILISASGEVTIEGKVFLAHTHSAIGGTPALKDSVGGACTGSTGGVV